VRLFFRYVLCLLRSNPRLCFLLFTLNDCDIMCYVRKAEEPHATKQRNEARTGVSVHPCSAGHDSETMVESRCKEALTRGKILRERGQNCDRVVTIMRMGVTVW